MPNVVLYLSQIAAMQAGLLKVVPQAVLDLLTWQEVEKKVCGDPEISVEALKRLSEYLALLNKNQHFVLRWCALLQETSKMFLVSKELWD